MRNFDYMKLANRMWDGEVLSYIAKIHECKGRQELFIRQKPVELERLVEIARIQSTEASNKIEGIVTTATRIRQLMDDKTTPKSRDEREIIGYRDVPVSYTHLDVYKRQSIQRVSLVLKFRMDCSFPHRLKILSYLTSVSEKKGLCQPA